MRAAIPRYYPRDNFQGYTKQRPYNTDPYLTKKQPYYDDFNFQYNVAAQGTSAGTSLAVKIGLVSLAMLISVVLISAVVGMSIYLATGM